LGWSVPGLDGEWSFVSLVAAQARAGDKANKTTTDKLRTQLPQRRALLLEPIAVTLM
jgi:hypothetical protein